MAQYGFTPLHWALYSGGAGVVDLLVAAKADIERKAVDGHTPLFWGVTQRNQSATKQLIDHNADITVSGRVRSFSVLRKRCS